MGRRGLGSGWTQAGEDLWRVGIQHLHFGSEETYATEPACDRSRPRLPKSIDNK